MMSSIRETINDLSNDLYTSGIIDKTTLRELTEVETPTVYEYTGDDIKAIRERQNVSQAVFAKFLNISPAMVKSLEQGTRQAKGAILKLINLVDENGLKYLS
ncbi:helix-turn-helix domain-containing protein [Fastidiosibacter lacustris]|uniref:helix-turn-helix domain-containing protein n=1 Tax=Fastidiosibacter lacustris TaxID=2056695 RepID=UPI000E347831|nr:helix-turn-helix domain-containing protein [Fastidiosibacter lacustris]